MRTDSFASLEKPHSQTSSEYPFAWLVITAKDESSFYYNGNFNTFRGQSNRPATTIYRQEVKRNCIPSAMCKTEIINKVIIIIIIIIIIINNKNNNNNNNKMGEEQIPYIRDIYEITKVFLSTDA